MWRAEWNPTVSRIYHDVLSKFLPLTLMSQITNVMGVQKRRSLSMASHRNRIDMQTSGGRADISYESVELPLDVRVILSYDHLLASH